MIVTIGLIVAVALCAVDQFQAQGRSLLAWAGIVGFGVLLLGLLG